MQEIQRTLIEHCSLAMSSVDFLDRAVKVIIRGRHVAAWSYVHASHIAESDVTYRNLFEDGQARMEKILEQLHEKMEPPAIAAILTPAPDLKDLKASAEACSVERTLERFNEWRLQTTNLLTSTDGFITKLLDAVENGLIPTPVPTPAAPGAPGATSSSGVTRTASRAGMGSPSAKRPRTNTNLNPNPEVIVIDSDEEGEGGRAAMHHAMTTRSRQSGSAGASQR